MTEDHIIKEMKRISIQLMNLSNNIGSSNTQAYDAVLRAEIELQEFISKVE